jgi:hypothetical protein
MATENGLCNTIITTHTGNYYKQITQKFTTA